VYSISLDSENVSQSQNAVAILNLRILGMKLGTHDELRIEDLLTNETSLINSGTQEIVGREGRVLKLSPSTAFRSLILRVQFNKAARTLSLTNASSKMQVCKKPATVLLRRMTDIYK
jgi:RNase P/RNase MRP subunit p29